ncbi:MAG: membrane dipeptidase, partial [Eubacteriales bacterium]|nr:membrane dipeptidase [Eubacteriales bacterium]
MWRVADTHCDALMHLSDDKPGLRADRHVTLAGLQKGQVALMTFAAFVGPEAQYGPPLLNGLASVDRYWRMIEAHSDALCPVINAAQLNDALARGKIGALLSVEGGGILQGSLAVLRLLHRLGVRMFGLTWSNDNELGCGCATDEDTGLTPLGLSVIAECNRLNMLIDVSHLSDKGFYQAWEASDTPIVASHSDARALCPGQKRNLTDDMLVKLGQKGGYVGVNFCHPF